MSNSQQGETPQPSPEPQQPVRDIMQVAVTDPKRRFVFDHEVDDLEYLPKLPYNKENLVFNPGHSAELYRRIPWLSDNFIYEIVSPDYKGRELSRRLVVFPIQTLVTDSNFRADTAARAEIIHFLDQELGNSFIPQFKPYLDALVRLESSSQPSETTQQDREKIMRGIKVMEQTAPTEERILHEAVRNFVNACQTANIDLTTAPGYQKFIKALQQNEETLRKLGLIY